MVSEPTIPSADDVYDMLMRDIEPDLVTENVPTLQTKYANETEAEHAARMDRYTKAHKQYDQAFAEYMRKLDQEVMAYRKAIMKEAEHKNRQQENSVLHKLEQSFS